MAGRKSFENGHADTAPEEEAPEETAPEETKSRKERIRDLLSKMEKSISKNAGKATVADFIRLTQLERELGQDEQPGKVVVTWKESTEKKK